MMFKNTNKAVIRDLHSGDFESVDIKTAIQRLQNIAEVEITKDDQRDLDRLRQWRNQILHYGYHFKVEQVSCRRVATSGARPPRRQQRHQIRHTHPPPRHQDRPPAVRRPGSAAFHRSPGSYDQPQFPSRISKSVIPTMSSRSTSPAHVSGRPGHGPHSPRSITKSATPTAPSPSRSPGILDRAAQLSMRPGPIVQHIRLWGWAEDVCSRILTATDECCPDKP